MQECPKCFKKYDDGQKICRTCGAILQAFVEEPQASIDEPQPAEDDTPSCGNCQCQAQPAASVKRRSWTCLQCGQSVPGDFEVCWNCGTSQDGVPDLEFEKVPPEQPWSGKATRRATCDQPSRRQCPKCGSDKVIPNARMLDQDRGFNGTLRVAVDGNPAALVFKDRLCDGLLADICGECGHVELKVENPRDLYDHYLQSRDS